LPHSYQLLFLFSMKLPVFTLGLLVAGTTAVAAQNFAVTGLNPTRNASSAPRASNVSVTFSQPPSAGSTSALRVFSSQRGGRLTGTASVSGSTLSFDPARDLRSGETVQATLTTAAQSTGGSALDAPQVFQFTAATQGGTGVFGGGSEVVVGNTPGGIATADVDDDGDIDLLAANSGSNTVSVRLNNGNGMFTAGSEVPVESSPLGMATADIDGDGDLDLLAANSGSASVSVRINNGNGTFTVPAIAANGRVAAGNMPQAVTMADVDGDGDLDILVANYVFSPNGTVSVRLNNGMGVFGGGSTVSVDSGTLDVAVGDIDNDGDVDLLTANFFNSTVSVRFNDGNGNFTGSQNMLVGRGVQSIVVADVNRDGYVDFLTADNQLQGAVNVRINNGQGSFSSGADVPLGFSVVGVTAADVDGDNDLDILASSYNSLTVNVRLNNGSGQFTSGADLAMAGRPLKLAAADVDGDGDLDFITSVAITGNPGAVSVRINNGTGTPLATTSRRAVGALSVAPNPAQGVVRVLLPAGARQVVVVNALGQQVRTLSVAPAATDVSLDVRGLPAGVYIAQAGAASSRLVVN
jgi:FG-GAP-like repeat/Bacterial Ig-like domain/Secretion system C-terminal sorting domain